MRMKTVSIDLMKSSLSLHLSKGTNGTIFSANFWQISFFNRTKNYLDLKIL